jgi:hypothetical protein
VAFLLFPRFQPPVTPRPLRKAFQTCLFLFRRGGDGDSARSQLIQICSLLRAPYQTLPVHDSLDSIGNRPSISPKPSEHPYPRPNPSQQEWLSFSPETFSDACLHFTKERRRRSPESMLSDFLFNKEFACVQLVGTGRLPLQNYGMCWQFVCDARPAYLFGTCYEINNPSLRQSCWRRKRSLASLIVG